MRVWIPVPQDALDYQKVLELSWRSPVAASLLWEPASRAPIISAAWLDPAMSQDIEITTRVATRDRTGYSPGASPNELAEYLRPTPSSPVDGIVLAKSREIVGSRTAALDKARAIYDWIVDNTFRRAETRGCGLGNIAFMLESGDMGGKCADINSLFVGLARAAGLPARDFFGIRVADSAVSKPLGKSGEITKAQHCRAEVFIEGKGWLPVDPADVRKVVLEEKLQMAQRSPQHASVVVLTLTAGYGFGVSHHLATPQRRRLGRGHRWQLVHDRPETGARKILAQPDGRTG